MLLVSLTNVIISITFVKEASFPCHLKNFTYKLMRKNNRAFTQLVEDPQFAAVGLTLLAQLARLRSVLVNLAGDVDDGSSDVHSRHVGSEVILASELAEDLGVPVARDSAPKFENVAHSERLPVMESKGTETLNATRSDARSAIDAIFQGLDDI